MGELKSDEYLTTLALYRFATRLERSEHTDLMAAAKVGEFRPKKLIALIKTVVLGLSNGLWQVDIKHTSFKCLSKMSEVALLVSTRLPLILRATHSTQCL